MRAKKRVLVGCTTRPLYIFTVNQHELKTIGADLVQMDVRMRRGKNPSATMELVVGETLSFQCGLLCSVVSVSFGVTGRTAKVLARVLFMEED